MSLPIASRPSRGTAILRSVALPLPALAILVAAAVAVAAAFRLFLRPADILGDALPFDTRSTDPAGALTAAVGLVAVAIGLLRRKRLAWDIAIVTFAASVLVQGLVLRHPIGAAAALICLAILVIGRRRYMIGATDIRRRSTMVALAAVIAGAAVEVTVVLLSARAPGVGIGNATAALAGAVTFVDVHPLSSLLSHGGLFAATVLAVRIPMVLIALDMLRVSPEPDSDPAVRARAREIGRRFGHGALLPFQLGDDKRLFAPDGHDGVVVYGRAGRFAVALGDPIGPEGWPAFRAWLAACRLRDQIPAVYQATGDSRGRLVAAGFRTFRIGEEAIVDLRTFDLSGSRRANLRHTVTRARRGGVEVAFYLHGLLASDRERLEPGLVAIDAAWRAVAGPEMGFTIHGFDRSELDEVAIAVATDAAGAPVAFATFRQTGTDDGWVLDVMRRLPGSVPGAFEACLVEAALAFRDAGASTLSLGLAPLAGLGAHSPAGEERQLARLGAAARPWYDVAGLAFFKGKLDPRWEPRFVAVRSRRDLPGLAIALLRLHLGGLGHATATILRGHLGRLARRVQSGTIRAGA